MKIQKSLFCRICPLLAGTLLLFDTATLQAGGGRNRVAGSEVAIEPARGGITVDGDLAEWDDSRGVLLTLSTAGMTEVESAYKDFTARVAFRYDNEALYVAVWWNDLTPLGSEKNEGFFPATDGLVLDFPQANGMSHLALWRDPQSGESQARLSRDGQSLETGSSPEGVEQFFKVTGKTTYSQEIRIPWAVIGSMPPESQDLRVGVQLCYGGFNDLKGYQSWLKKLMGLADNNDRWGGNLSIGLMDGFADATQPAVRGFDPVNGGTVKLSPAGTVAPLVAPTTILGVEQTRTTEMVAVPAGKILIDGVMEEGEWDPKASSMVAYEPTVFPSRYAVATNWAYDDKGLYVGFRWFTGGPQFNQNNPLKFNRGYDGGDAVQIRLGTDRVSHVDSWQFTAGGKPAMKIEYGVKMNEGTVEDALSRGARMAIKETQGGYFQEIFLPWELITTDGRALKIGESFQTILDLFFSGREGNRIPFIVNAKLAPSTGVVDLPFQAPANGFFTMVVDDAQGRQVRRLLAHTKLSKGQQVEWDGLGNNGEPAPAGKYQYRGLYHQGIGLKYLTSYHNPGNPTWRTADGKGEWGGDHSPPQAVAADADGVYVGWASAEDGDGVIHLDFEGQRQWGFFQTPTKPAGGGAAYMAADGDKLYYLNDTMVRPEAGENELAYVETMISCLDRKTGRRAGFSAAQPYHTLGKYNSSQVKVSWMWDLIRDKSFSLDTYGIHDDYFYSGHCMGANVSGLAARDGKIYVSFRLPQVVAVYKADDMERIAEWPLPEPGGLAFGADGDLFAVSGKSVVRLDVQTGKAVPVVASGLDAPVGITLDKDGEIYVSDWAGAQCVKVFSKDGKPLRTIGKEGGRAWIGAYDPKGMLLPRGLAVDKNDRLWVTEDDSFPRRVSVWEAKTGKLWKEFVGGTNYGATQGGVVDPKNPDQAVSQSVLFDIDLNKDGSYRPLSTIWRQMDEKSIFGLAEKAITDRFIHKDGRTFYISAAHGATVVGEIKGGRWYPLAAVGGVYNRGDNPMVLPESKLVWRQSVFPEFFQERSGYNFIWTDVNGDTQVQPEEMQWRKQTQEFPSLGMYWGTGGLDADFNLLTGGISNGSVVARFELKGWTPGGAPQYSFDSSKVLVPPPGTFRSLSVGDDGKFYTAENGERRKPDHQPLLSGYSPEGKLLWTYPTTKDSRLMGNINGDGLMGPVKAGGETGEIVSLTQWHGLYVPFVTSDGLFVGRVLRDPSEGGEPGPDMYRGETVQHLNQLEDGRLILSHGKNAHHLFEVTGFETVKRFQGDFTLSAQQVAMAEERLADLRSRSEAVAPIRVVSVTNAVAVDGNLEGWNPEAFVAIGSKDAVPRGEVALAYDKDNLYLAYKVSKKGGFFNNGQNPNELFLSGDAVDLQFATDPAADPARRAPVLGDTRLLLSKFGDEPVAVVYKAEVPGAKKPVSFSSPTRSVIFDEVTTVKGAQVVIKDSADGYVVEAAVPLKAIGLVPEGNAPALWPGRALAGDAGFIVADTTGRRVARIYRFNQDTQLTADVPTEAALNPAQWGILAVDRPTKK